MKPHYQTKLLNTPHYTLQLYVDYFNERLRVDDYRGNMERIVKVLFEMMETYSFTKLIFYTRREHWRKLLSKGFTLEGTIDGFFNGSDNYIMTYYRTDERCISRKWIEENNIIQDIFAKGKKTEEANLPQNYSFRKATNNDSTELAKLYGRVFPVYPTPMDKAEYVEKMINSGTVFYLVEKKDGENTQIVSAASAEINKTNHNAELTDCATLPEHRKYGLMKKLLLQLEKDLVNDGIYCAYSLARALSYGMNAALYQLGYQYSGRLTNNCYIFSDQFEDMNVWVKDLTTK